MSKIKIGVVGLGGIATAVHLPGIQKSSAGEIAAICDISPETLAAVGERYGVPEDRRFVDYRELIACPDIEAVDICTPNFLHKDAVMETIRYKKPFCVEKPLALNYTEAVQMEAAAVKAGIRGMVCFSYRFKPAVRFARWIISQGHIGDVLNVFVQYLKSSALREGRRLEWRFVKKYAGSGVLGDLGSHMIDMTRFLLGDFIGVFARTGIAVKQRMQLDSDKMSPVEADDYCNFLAELKCGAAATFSISRCAISGENSMTYEIYGTKGAIAFDMNNPDILRVCVGDIDRMTRGMHTVNVPRAYYADQTEAFLDIVKGTGDGLSPLLADGVECQKIIDTLLETNDKGKWMLIK